MKELVGEIFAIMKEVNTNNLLLQTVSSILLWLYWCLQSPLK